MFFAHRQAGMPAYAQKTPLISHWTYESSTGPWESLDQAVAHAFRKNWSRIP